MKVAPPILNLALNGNEWSALLHWGGSVPSTHGIEGFTYHKDSLDDLEKLKTSSLP